MQRLLFLVLLFVNLLGFSQNNTPTYTWRMHLPYNSVRQIVEADDLMGMSLGGIIADARRVGDLQEASV